MKYRGPTYARVQAKERLVSLSRIAAECSRMRAEASRTAGPASSFKAPTWWIADLGWFLYRR
jgi:hypothetical protein